MIDDEQMEKDVAAVWAEFNAGNITPEEAVRAAYRLGRISGLEEGLAALKRLAS